MSFVIPKIDADIKAPVEKSCNCCDVITCYFFCCTKKNKSPQNKLQRQVTAVSESVIKDKIDEKKDKA